MIIPKIELCQIAVEMLFAAVPVDALHAPFEDAGHLFGFVKYTIANILV